MSYIAPPRVTNGVLLKPCNTCRWFNKANEQARCHANPPQIRVPYDNMSAWPVVPDKGGGCRLHEERIQS